MGQEVAQWKWLAWPGEKVGWHMACLGPDICVCWGETNPNSVSQWVNCCKWDQELKLKYNLM